MQLMLWGGKYENPLIVKQKIANTFDLILNLYSEKHRSHHTIENHIIPLLNLFFKNIDYAKNPVVIIFVAILHDVIYNPLSDFNEEASAMFALSIIPNNDLGTSVYNIITYDKQTDKPNDSDCKLFHDLDFSVLTLKWPKYIRYCENIKSEYIKVYSLEAYYAGRSAWIEKTLENPIFLTCPFKEKFEETAIINLERELLSIKFDSNQKPS